MRSAKTSSIADGTQLLSSNYFLHFMAFLEDGKWLIVYFMISFVCSQRKKNLAKGFQQQVRDLSWNISSEAYTQSRRSLHRVSSKMRKKKNANKMLMRVSKQLRYNFMHACLIVYHYRTWEEAKGAGWECWTWAYRDWEWDSLFASLKFNWINFAPCISVEI